MSLRTARNPDASPRPTLSLFDTVAIIVGMVIGAGIFETPPLIAANSSGAAAMLLAWVAGGAITVIGALCYAELATAYPDPGGNYVYLKRAFGEPPAFLLAWSRLAVIQTGSIAMLGYIFGDYAAQAYAPFPYAVPVYAALAIVVLTVLNVAGISLGKRTQNLLTLCTLAGMLLVIVAALNLGGASPSPTAGTGSVAGSLGLAMIFVLLSYGGWSEAAYVSAEVRRPRDITRALVVSVIIICAVYLVLNYALLRALGLEGLAQSKAVGAEILRRSFGEAGAWLLAALVGVTALDSMNASIITGARTSYALGRDHSLFSFLGRWHPRANTPVHALITQSIIALGLVGLGSLTRQGFKSMVEYTAPVFWLFLLLTGIALMVLRRVEPDRPRPFRVPAYPLLPLIFIATSAYMLYASLAYTGMGALLGAVVLVSGIPLLAISRRRAAPPLRPPLEPVLPKEAA